MPRSCRSMVTYYDNDNTDVAWEHSRTVFIFFCDSLLSLFPRLSAHLFFFLVLPRNFIGPRFSTSSALRITECKLYGESGALEGPNHVPLFFAHMDLDIGFLLIETDCCIQNTYTKATVRGPMDGGDDSVWGFPFSVCNKPRWPMSASPKCLVLVEGTCEVRLTSDQFISAHCSNFPGFCCVGVTMMAEMHELQWFLCINCWWSA